ncbi:undecaprenyldiphospho-muramoylpentapeptide beta-N- acetylglucosaminyltransferase [Fictibacillus macauensis ZFHKF-1]|uniref:UDP-N-acetylglucosamine--N-acetylmuramyl-(pentapeptide) pyrophosphoryl-undecaprenol N-acetylglucosamine transferase n=1 Tax=Fictibacillus macauensis ZFHKF-1 TaxID=1196324 RepID=I8UDM8_9BACL|nr:undecaprenyldiphospho-muramoylpentapeptide beta-N-acetylglucosaminyltransferase [Fictibacillus macauensis]EIT84995.1 undecaprenyldiphospho-muramoylpentapeptide beta-N- acetylglucosaminyltransferase [Fictibacillus macauensis ZFHKF-1]
MKVVLSGGGTGGHIYPALSIAKEIKKVDPNAEILYIGTEKGLESDLVPREGIPFKSIHITGFKRSLSLDNIKTLMRFLKGVAQCKKMIKEFQPDVVIGTGGYVCGPVVYAASRLGIPSIIHEQNSVPGLTNKFLSRYVKKIALSFQESASFFPSDKVVLTGNPRASEVLGKSGAKGRESLGLDPVKKTVLIVGGSRGARPINEAFLQVLQEAGRKEYQFVYVTGDVHYENVQQAVQASGSPSNVTIVPFVHNMPEVLAGVDLVVARAGATSIAELTALGIPSILIPSPYVTNNHQEKNARALEAPGAAAVILENEMSGEKLLQEVDRILTNQEHWLAMHRAAKKLGMPEAAATIVRLIEELSIKK